VAIRQTVTLIPFTWKRIRYPSFPAFRETGIPIDPKRIKKRRNFFKEIILRFLLMFFP
jgi:hypothetical protein